MVTLVERGRCPNCGYDFSKLKGYAAPATSRPLFAPTVVEPRREPEKSRLPPIKTIRRTLAARLIRARHGTEGQAEKQAAPMSPVVSLSAPRPLRRRRRRAARPRAAAFEVPVPSRYQVESAARAMTAQIARFGAAAAAGVGSLGRAAAGAWRAVAGSMAAAARAVARALAAATGGLLGALEAAGRAVVRAAGFALYLINVLLVALLVGFAKVKSAVQSLMSGIAGVLRRRAAEPVEERTTPTVEHIPMIPLVPLDEAQSAVQRQETRREVELPVIDQSGLEPEPLAEATARAAPEVRLPTIQKVVTEYAPLSMILERVEAKPAGVIPRALAGVVDVLIVAAVVVVFLIPAWLAGAFDFLSIAPSRFAAVVLAVYLFAIAVAGVYHVVSTSAYGRTLGKRLTGIRVVDISGEPLGLLDAAVRFSAWLISGLFFGLGWLWLVFDLNHRGLHDYLSRTVVIRDVAEV